jgi:hypothetical protein
VKLFTKKKKYVSNLERDARSSPSKATHKGIVDLTKMTSLERFDNLYSCCGANGVLNLMDATILRRFKKYMDKMKAELNVSLQPMVTLEERDIILKIASIYDLL